MAGWVDEEIVTERGRFSLRFGDLERLMWNVITGKAEEEDQIEASFAALFGLQPFLRSGAPRRCFLADGPSVLTHAREGRISADVP